MVATQTTAFTPSNFDITPYAAPGTTHTISVDVKGRNALKNPSNGKYLVPDAAEWSEAVPQGIYRSAFLRVYPAVYVSDTFVRTSVANQSLTYDVSVTNTSSSSRTVTLTGSLASDNGASFSYPTLPSRTVTVAAHSTATVTVGPVAWNLGAASYWWPNVPYQSGYRAQLHVLSIHAATDDGHTSDASYRFGFRESTQNGAYYYLNGVRVNFRGDNLQGADFDRINNGGKGDAYDTLPGFLPPSPGNGGWPQAVDNYQRLNYNVVRIHQEPASPYMLDVADEMGLMIIDESAIRGSGGLPGLLAGHDNMVNHDRALALRDRNHPAVIRWSQANEPNVSGMDSEQFEKDLYAAINGADGTRPISVDAGVGASPNQYPTMTYGNFDIFPHYLDGIGQVRRGGLVRARPARRRGRVHLAGVQHQAGLRMVRHRDRGETRQGRQRPAPLHPAVGLGRLRARRADHRLHARGGRPSRLRRGQPARPLEQPADPTGSGRVQPERRDRPALLVGLWRIGFQRRLPAAPGCPRLRRQQHGEPHHHRVQRRLHRHRRRLRLERPPRQRHRPGDRLRQHDPHHPARLEGDPDRVVHRPGQRLTGIPRPVHQQVRHHHVQRRGRVLHPRRRNGPDAGHLPHHQPQQRQAAGHRGQLPADGAKAVQQTGNATWTLSASGSAFVLSYVPTGKVLDVNGGSTTAGLQLQQWTANGGANQQWLLRPTGDGYYTIVSNSSGLVADVYGQSTSDGAAVVQWTANGGTNQQWQLTPA